MDIQNKGIWQLACGDTDRNHSKICLDWDVVLNGPGYAGAFPQCEKILINDNCSSKKRADIERFATEIETGDIVVLRLGTKKVLGVGVVVGDYEWNEIFSDVDGWNLQHIRRVRWLWKNLEQPKCFDAFSLKWGDTTQKLTNAAIKQWLSGLIFSEEELNRPIKKLPVGMKDVTQEEIAEYLYGQGISDNSIELLAEKFNELRRIAKWYYQEKKAPSEYETIAYLIVPILRALGWTPQKMAIEWCNIDIALFNQLPRNDDNIAIIVEAKKKGNSCLTAINQAEGYARGKKNCNRLIVTDGLRYGIYLLMDKKYRLYAYFNLLSLKEGYPIYNCKGAKEALSIMTPEWREK